MFINSSAVLLALKGVASSATKPTEANTLKYPSRSPSQPELFYDFRDSRKSFALHIMRLRNHNTGFRKFLAYLTLLPMES